MVWLAEDAGGMVITPNVVLQPRAKPGGWNHGLGEPVASSFLLHVSCGERDTHVVWNGDSELLH